MRDRFRDLSTGETYEWHVNHDSEEQSGRARAINVTPNTAATEGLKSQGDQSPLVLSWSGTILHRAQHTAMWHFFELCQWYTIELRDFDGQTYEVVISAFKPQRIRGENKNDPSTPHHYWKYTIEFTIINLLSGDLAGVIER